MIKQFNMTNMFCPMCRRINTFYYLTHPKVCACGFIFEDK